MTDVIWEWTWGNLDEMEAKLYQGTINGFDDVTDDWNDFTEEKFQDSSIVALDIDNDSDVDLVKSYPGTGIHDDWVFLNDGDLSFTNVTSAWEAKLPNTYFSNTSTKVFDINSDGLPDVVENSGCPSNCSNKIWLGNGEDGWDDASSTIVLPSKNFHPGLTAIDVNNDGLNDLVQVYPVNYQVHSSALYINDGAGGFVNATSSWTFPNISIEYSTFSDVNGDGLVDMIFQNKFYLNTGSGWVQDTAFTGTYPSYYIYGNGFFFEDFNADGLVDAVSENHAGYATNDLAYIHNGVKPDILQSVTSPQGGETTFGYTSSAQLLDASDDPVNSKLPFVFPVVTSVTEDDGLGNSTTTEYFYEDGRFVNTTVYDGRFAGFNKVTKTYDDGTYEVTYFHQGGGVDDSSNGEYSDHIDKIGRVYRTEVYSASDALLQETITKWDRSALSTDRGYVFKARESTRTYNPTSGHYDSAVEYTYDAYGNVETVTDYGTATVAADGSFTDTGTDKQVVTNDFVTTTSPYLVGLQSEQEITDNSSNVVARTEWIYDGQSAGAATLGNVTKVKRLITDNPSNDYTEESFTYNAYGNVLTHTDGEGNVTSFSSYDSWNMYPDEITNAKSQVSTQTTDIVTGQVTASEDANGFEQERDVDTFGRVEEERVEVVSGSGLVTISEYSYSTTSVPNRVSVTSHMNGTDSTVAYTYVDGFGRTVQTRTLMMTGNYSVVDIAYDSHGRANETSLPYEVAGSSYSTPSSTAADVVTNFDALNRVTSVADDVGTVSHVYADRSDEVTDEEGNVKLYEYDARGNLITVEENENTSTFVTEYEYDNLGNITKVTDSQDNIREFTYDMLGRRLSMTAMHDVSSSTYGVWSYEYDDANNLVEKVDANGVTTTYTFDDLNRILTEDADSVSGTEVSYTYDTGTNGVGRVASVTRGDVTIDYGYTIRGELAYDQYDIDSSSYAATTYEYDYLGNETSRTYPNGKELTTSYNEQGLPETIMLDSSEILTAYDYNANNQPEEIWYNNGVGTYNTYDPDQRYWMTGRYTFFGTDEYQNLSYTYDDVGNITEIDDASDLATAMTVNYWYDDLYRLTDVATTGSATNYSRSYGYDSIGNMTWNPIFGTMTYGDDDNVHALTAFDNRTWSYDDNGNVTDNWYSSMTWSYRDELLNVNDGTTSVNYMYDHTGDRVQKAVVGGETTVYIGDYVYEQNADTEEIHISFLGQPVFEWENVADTTYTDSWIHADHLGSVAVMTDAYGDWTVNRDYYPFGEIRTDATQGAAVDNRFGYTNKELDEETDSDLAYFEARYLTEEYDVGRFMSSDPWEGDYRDPQSLNKYAYAGNKPVNYVDPSGNVKVSFKKLAQAAVNVVSTAVAPSASLAVSAAVSTAGVVVNRLRTKYVKPVTSYIESGPEYMAVMETGSNEAMRNAIFDKSLEVANGNEAAALGLSTLATLSGGSTLDGLILHDYHEPNVLSERLDNLPSELDGQYNEPSVENRRDKNQHYFASAGIAYIWNQSVADHMGRLFERFEERFAGQEFDETDIDANRRGQQFGESLRNDD